MMAGPASRIATTCRRVAGEACGWRVTGPGQAAPRTAAHATAHAGRDEGVPSPLRHGEPRRAAAIQETSSESSRPTRSMPLILPLPLREGVGGGVCARRRAWQEQTSLSVPVLRRSRPGRAESPPPPTPSRGGRGRIKSLCRKSGSYSEKGLIQGREALDRDGAQLLSGFGGLGGGRAGGSSRIGSATGYHRGFGVAGDPGASGRA
jgi:hypothetical protein